ncbi:hypothetical protein BDR06DRAFT_971950 [Suillus hirtellus]|nr:hypothetical protein BDR06DRAFT_971950 [Suillus hirtellus]
MSNLVLNIQSATGISAQRNKTPTKSNLISFDYGEMVSRYLLSHVQKVIIDPMHNLFLGLVKTHFYNIWVQNKILRPNYELQMFHKMLADSIIPGSCGKLPTDIGMLSGGSLTADQWLLLSTVYGPIILWSACLPSNTDNQMLQQHFAIIQRSEADKQAQATRKAKDKQALAEAKKCGKEAFEAEKACIASQKLADAEAKKNKKLRLTTVKQAEKVQLTAKKKAKTAQRKGKCKATEQSVPDLPEGQLWCEEVIVTG